MAQLRRIALIFAKHIENCSLFRKRKRERKRKRKRERERTGTHGNGNAREPTGTKEPVVGNSDLS